MGYFSNGTEGMIYRDQYCDQCKHDINNDCPIWLAHLLCNYEKNKQVQQLLALFIPESKDGLYNLECKMFDQLEATEDMFDEKENKSKESKTQKAER